MHIHKWTLKHIKNTQMYTIYVHIVLYLYKNMFINTQRPFLCFQPKHIFLGWVWQDPNPTQVAVVSVSPVLPRVQPPSPRTFICWVLGLWPRHSSKNSWATWLPGLRKPKHRAASRAASCDDFFITVCSTHTRFFSSPTWILWEGDSSWNGQLERLCLQSGFRPYNWSKSSPPITSSLYLSQ